MSGQGKAALCAAALALGLSAPAQARPFTVDDLLHQASFDQAVLNPEGRWALFEKRAPYDSGAEYDYGLSTGEAFDELWQVDLRRRGPARPALGEGVRGVTMHGLSPDGRRLALTRLQRGRRMLGVLSPDTGAVRWFDVTPEWSDEGRALQWLDARTLLVLHRTDNSLSWLYSHARIAPERLPALWAAAARGKAAVTVTGTGAYAALRPKPAPIEVLRIDVETGAREVLARGAFDDLEISPDHRFAALRENGEDIRYPPGRPLHGDWGLSVQRQRLAIIDLRTGALKRFGHAFDILPHLMAWSPSGRRLLVYTRQDETPWSQGMLREVDPVTGAAEPCGGGLVPDTRGRPNLIHAGWMGETPVVLARRSPEERLDWWRVDRRGAVNLTAVLPEAPRRLEAVEAGGFTALVRGALWRVDAAGHAERMPSPPLQDVHGALVDKDTREAFVPPSGSFATAAAGPRRRLTWVGPDGLKALLDLPADGEVVTAARQPRLAILREETPDGVQRLVLVGPQTSATIGEASPGLAKTDPPRIVAIHHTGPDGQALTSWLFLPPVRPGPPPPLIVRAYLGDTYGAPARDWAMPLGGVTSIRMLVGHGYAVLTPSLPKPKGTHAPMAGIAERLLAIIDKAAADPALAGAFDPGRMAIWGHSYGGFTVTAVLSQTGRFRAAVCAFGAYNPILNWADMGQGATVAPEADVFPPWPMGNTEAGQGDMGGPPWAEPTRYVQNSPLFVADRIRTPIFFVRGDQDLIPTFQADVMYAAMVRNGQDAILATYWGEPHTLVSPGNLRDFWTRAFAFLDGRLASPGSATSARRPATALASAAPRPRPSPR